MLTMIGKHFQSRSRTCGIEQTRSACASYLPSKVDTAEGSAPPVKMWFLFMYLASVHAKDFAIIFPCDQTASSCVACISMFEVVPDSEDKQRVRNGTDGRIPLQATANVHLSSTTKYDEDYVFCSRLSGCSSLTSHSFYHYVDDSLHAASRLRNLDKLYQFNSSMTEWRPCTTFS